MGCFGTICIANPPTYCDFEKIGWMAVGVEKMNAGWGKAEEEEEEEGPDDTDSGYGVGGGWGGICFCLFVCLSVVGITFCCVSTPSNPAIAAADRGKAIIILFTGNKNQQDILYREK